MSLTAMIWSEDADNQSGADIQYNGTSSSAILLLYKSSTSIPSFNTNRSTTELGDKAVAKQHVNIFLLKTINRCSLRTVCYCRHITERLATLHRVHLSECLLLMCNQKLWCSETACYSISGLQICWCYMSTPWGLCWYIQASFLPFVFFLWCTLVKILKGSFTTTRFSPRLNY